MKGGLLVLSRRLENLFFFTQGDSKTRCKTAPWGACWFSAGREGRFMLEGRLPLLLHPPEVGKVLSPLTLLCKLS